MYHWGNNRFLAGKREVDFTPIFKDDDKIGILVMHRGFHSDTAGKCLVSNIILLTDEEKVNAMSCSELN